MDSESERSRERELRLGGPGGPFQNGWIDGVCHALTSFDTRCPVPHHPDCFRPSDQLAGWDSHPLEIADFHGVLSYWHFLGGASLPATR